MKKRFGLVLLLQAYVTQCWALYSAEPAATLHTYLENSEMVVVGQVSHVKAIESYKAFNRGLSLVKLEDAYYIDANGKNVFTKPIYLYLKNYSETLNESPFIFLLSNLSTHPHPTSRFRINDDDTIFFHTAWHGSGLIHKVGESGSISYTRKFDACIKTEYARNTGKRYQCRIGDYVEYSHIDPHTRPPMPFREFERKIQEYLIENNIIFHGDTSKLHNTQLGPTLVKYKLKSLEPIDNFFIEALQSVPLSEQLLNLINERDKGRGNSGDYVNDPKLVEEYKKLDAKQRKDEDRLNCELC